jgi:cystathionine beta-lyase
MFGNDVLPSHYAEMDFALAPVIVKEIGAALRSGDLGYAYAPGAGLGEAFADFARRRWSWTVDPDTVVAVPDVMVGVVELLRIVTSPGAGVVINTPVYPPFFTVVAEAGRQVVEVPMERSTEGWRLPLDGITVAFDKGAEALLLCNPHNPTGHVASREELLELAEVAARYDVVLLSDEVHAPLTLPGATHIPLCTMPEAEPRSIVLTSASKAWNIPGLKCAIAVAQSSAMREALAALPVEQSERVGHLGVLASAAAFRDGEPWLDELLEYLDETRRWMPAVLAEQLPGIVYEPGEATYLAWLDCRPLGLGDDPAAHFFERGRVALSPGTEFGSPGRGFARLNLATSRALIEEALSRMSKAVPT